MNPIAIFDHLPFRACRLMPLRYAVCREDPLRAGNLFQKSVWGLKHKDNGSSTRTRNMSTLSVMQERDNAVGQHSWMILINDPTHDAEE